MTAIAVEASPKRTSGRSRWRAASNVRRVRKLDRETRPTDSNNIFRWYRSGWGRYTSADPIGLMGGSNLYRYADDNPFSFIDPLGLVCGITVWQEDVTYGFSPSAWKSGFKRTWGHRWIEYPGGSVGFWPGRTPSNPFEKVAGWIQSPDPKTKTPHSTQYTESDTYFTVPDGRKECMTCDKALSCLKQFAQRYSCSYSLTGEQCRTFVDEALAACSLSTRSPAEYWSTHK